MGRRRRRKLRMDGAIKRKPGKQTKDSSKGGSDGADLVKRFGLEGEPREEGDKLQAFLQMVEDDVSRPGFDRDKYIRAHNLNEVQVELVDGLIYMKEDEGLTAIMAISNAISEGRLEEAKSLVDKAEKQYGYDGFMDRYMMLMHEGEFEEALALCNKRLTSKPSTYVIECKVEVLREMGRMQEQLDLFDQWDAHFHDDPQFLAARGRALVAVGRLDEAEKTTLRALELDDDLPIRQFIALGELQLARGDPEGAIKLFNRTLDIDEYETDARIGKANALVSMGKHEQAILVCEQLLSRSSMQGRLKRVRDRIRAAAQV